MGPSQPSQDDNYVTDYQQAARMDGFSPDHVVSSFQNRMGPRRLVPSLPVHLPGLSPSPTASSLYASSPTRNEATTLESPSFISTLPTTPHYPNYLPTGVQNQGHRLGYPQGLFNGPPPRSNSPFGPPQGSPYVMPPPQEAERNFNTRVFEYQRSNLEQAAFRSPTPSFPLNGSESGWAGAQDEVPSFGNRAFPSGGGEHQGKLQIINEPATRADLRSLNANRHGTDTYATTGSTASVFGRPPWGARGHRYEPYRDARSRHRRTQSPGPSMSSPPSEGGFYLPEHPAPSDPHSLSDEIVGNEAQPEAVPWNLPSARTPNQPMGVEPSRSTAGATETANHVQNTPGGKRKPRKKREEFKAFLAALPANPVGRGPTRMELVPQTWYKCRSRQEDRRECPPIEFGGIRLTNAANEAYSGLEGATEKVLNYEGAGSAITCRLTFAGSDIGTAKILTTNSKTPRGHITKRKLAFELAMFVWDCLGRIQDQPGCADIAFQDLVLVRLVRVAKASWQPVLYYEAPIPTPRPRQDVPQDSFA